MWKVEIREQEWPAILSQGSRSKVAVSLKGNTCMISDSLFTRHE